MTNIQIVNDPWLKDSDRSSDIPCNAEFICAYEVDIILECLTEASFLVRTKTHLEYWKSSGLFDDTTVKQLSLGELSIDEFNKIDRLSTGLAFAFPRKESDSEVILFMLEKLMRAYYGFESVGSYLHGSLVSEMEFNMLKMKLEQERNKIIEQTKNNETEIILAARELDLHPRPTGNNPGIWHARCSRTKYGMFINAKENEFRCAVTKCKGGINELRACVIKHK